MMKSRRHESPAPTHPNGHHNKQQSLLSPGATQTQRNQAFGGQNNSQDYMIRNNDSLNSSIDSRYKLQPYAQNTAEKHASVNNSIDMKSSTAGSRAISVP